MSLLLLTGRIVKISVIDTAKVRKAAIVSLTELLRVAAPTPRDPLGAARWLLCLG